MREGRISVAAGFANMHSGLIGDEEMNRLVYLAEKFRKRVFGPDRGGAYQNDVPGFSWAYPRVFAGSGVKYLITGLNLFIGGGNNFGVRTHRSIGRALTAAVFSPSSLTNRMSKATDGT